MSINVKQILFKLPEYYLLVLIILSGYSPPFTFNTIALVLAAILILQIIFTNKISGLIIAGVFLLINLYMLGALISEFNEFPEFNKEAKQLLFVGLSLWSLNMVTSIMMIYKYAKTDENNSQIEYKQQES